MSDADKEYNCLTCYDGGIVPSMTDSPDYYCTCEAGLQLQGKYSSGSGSTGSSPGGGVSPSLVIGMLLVVGFWGGCLYLLYWRIFG